MEGTKTIGRVAGVLYLSVAVAAGIAGYARAAVTVAGDASATAANIRESVPLFRVGIAADLLSATAFLLLALTLYVLLREVNHSAAVAMVTLVAVCVAIQSLNLLNEVAALVLATDPGYGEALGSAGSASLSQMFLGLQHYGFVISQMFFALWLMPLAYLVVRSGSFPSALGYLLAIAGCGYLVELFAYLLAPALDGYVLPFSAIAGALGELTFALWLVVKGAKVALPDPSRAVSVAVQPSGAGGY
jgi:hypothetical protein